MKFNNIPYKRPSIQEFKASFKTILSKLELADTFEVQNNAIVNLYKLTDDFNTMFQLGNIKYTLDTNNDFFEKEVNYYDEVMPLIDNLFNKYYKILNASKFKATLTEKWGNHILNIAKYKVKGFDPAIMDDMKEEAKLSTKYTKIKGTAEIEYNGEKLNLPGLEPYMLSEDRAVRKSANLAYWNFFSKKQDDLDSLFDKQVKLRNEMGKKLGFKNYIELGYNRMSRMDYTKEMVQNFRKQIVDEIVPIATQLRERQRVRLGYDKLEFHDLGFHFTSGNPKPKGTVNEILGKAKVMYKELSAETEEFFNYMLANNLMDVENRPGKADAGYCWCLSKFKHPFIFANFNGTAGDIDVLTHEAGHAFQYYESRNYEIMEYRTPSIESAEIHSMSMEFLTYPWMESFFEADTEKYFFSHLNGSILFLPYGCAVDHFQHIIYENPEFSADERADAWKQMEDLYLPGVPRDLAPNLANGRFWHKLGHIFESPFYFIDYVLAQICAFQFWQKANTNRKEAWKDYLCLCKAGGTAPFLELVKLANLKSPFKDGTVKSITGGILNHLNSINDSKF